MIIQPDAPPAPPSPEALARMRAENEALTAQLTNQALRGAVAGGRPEQPPGGPRSVSVTKDPTGKVVVTTGDGRTVIYDPKVGLDEDAIQTMIQTALEPQRVQVNSNAGVNPIPIVAIVCSFLFLLALLVSRTRIAGRRAMAAASGPGMSAELSSRLARIEQAVEAVAIEVERISESERYSARLLTERLPERVGDRGSASNGQGLAAAPAPTLDASR